MKKEIKQSFIGENPTREIVSCVGRLRDLMAKSEADEQFCLENLDLSQIDENDFRSICFDNYTLKDVVFSRFNPDCDRRRHLFNLSFKGATLLGVSFAQARMQQCNFDESNIQSVDFFLSELEFCRFRDSVANRVDFRYSHVIDCTMGRFDVNLGDFYFCSFKGCTNFIGSRFVNCSFTCSSFENACIRLDNIPEGIVQQHSKVYTEEIIQSKDWHKYNPCATISQMNEKVMKGNTLENRIELAKESMDFYRQISGTFAGKGLNRDSNRAYREAKKCERRYHGRTLKALWKGEIEKSKDGRGKYYHFLKYMRTWIQWAFGYGYIWWAAVIWFVAMVVIYGIIAIFGKEDQVSYTHCSTGTVDSSEVSDIESLCYSLYNSMSPHDGFCHLVNLPWASFESIAGVLIIGFLGFIIANNIRNDS